MPPADSNSYGAISTKARDHLLTIEDFWGHEIYLFSLPETKTAEFTIIRSALVVDGVNTYESNEQYNVIGMNKDF